MLLRWIKSTVIIIGARTMLLTSAIEGGGEREGGTHDAEPHELGNSAAGNVCNHCLGVACPHTCSGARNTFVYHLVFLEVYLGHFREAIAGKSRLYKDREHV